MEIREVRISLLWTETIVGHWRRAPRPGFEFLHGGTHYERHYDRIRAGGASDPFDLPWKHDANSRFWYYYLESGYPSQVRAHRGWKSLVPFCRRGPRVDTRELPFKHRSLQQLMTYPHGQTFGLTLRLTARQSLEEAARSLILLRRGRAAVTLDGGRTASGGLTRIARTVLEHGRREVFDDTPVARGVEEPYRVVTFIRADGVGVDAPADGATRDLLAAITDWPVDGSLRPPPGDDVRVVPQPSEPGDVVWTGPRSRTVWYPRLFVRQAPRLPSLACYHRNQTYAAAQVESLGGLASVTRSELAGGHGLEYRHEECVRRAAGALGRLRGGRGSYRSSLVRDHIDRNFIDDLDRIREHLGMDRIERESLAPSSPEESP